MNKNKHAFSYTVWILSLLLIVSCQKAKNGSKLTVYELDYNDSLVYAAMEHDYNQALLVVDSLEDVHALYDAKINFYRAQIHYKMGQELSAELYYKKALTGNELYKDQPSIFYFAYDQLSTILTIKGDQQGALATATEAYSIAQKDKTESGQEWQAILLHDIGYCQMQLSRTAEAEKNFTHAYNYSWARVAYNIMDAYTTTNNFEQAEKWVVAAEEAINRLVESPDCSKRTAEEYLGSLGTHKAIVLIKTGQRQEADKIYREFLKSDYSKTSIGLVDNSEYLEMAERWDDLSLANSWAMPKSMYYLKTYLIPFFNAYQKSGRHDKALMAARRIAESIDSVDEYERKHNAAELAIIYETREKEAKIAEQETAMTQQRILAVSIAMLLIIIFLVIFTYHRYRSTKRLAEKNLELEQKNKELTIANARANESSQMKTNFIRQISHEIRTPLNILNGFAQVITGKDVELGTDEKKDIQQRIRENSERITELVDKMLELSEASSQTIIERTDETTTNIIANKAIDNSGICHTEHIKFDLQLKEGTKDFQLLTNQRYATRALVLLLDNAKKFTKEGTVRLVISQKPSEVAFTVEDTGIGVPAKQAEHIFEAFVQLDEYYEGTGIGLSVARSIVRRLGGDIVLDTTYQEGARFIMTLPKET